MRVLAVLYAYPPLLVPASMCYVKLVAALRASAVDVEIVTVAPDSFDSPGGLGIDDSLNAIIPPDVVNHVVRSPELSFLVRLAKKFDPKRRFTYPWLEPRKREWTLPARRYLRKLDLSRYDALLTCSQPHGNHLLGLDAKRRSGLPWVAYFSDPWSDNPYARYPSDRIREYHKRLENEVLSEADLVLHTCEEMSRLVQQRHPSLASGRSGVLPHAFVPGWYDQAVTAEVPPPAPGLRILQTGNFYGPRTPMPLIEALERLSRRRPLEGVLTIESYGDMEDEHIQAVRERGLENVFRLHGHIPYLQTLHLMRQHDAMILVDAPLETTAESVFLPSKLIDYLGSGRPIIAATPERGATARVVASAGGVVCPLERPGTLEEALTEVLERGVGHLEPQAAELEPYEVGNVGRALTRMLEEVAA